MKYSLCSKKILIFLNEASPQQAAGYQEENLIMMRNHGFSNSSL
jgi:hypothetical protein